MFTKAILPFLLLSLLNVASRATASGLARGDLIYFGKEDEPVGFSACWRVLDPEKTNMGTPGAFLLCETLIANEEGKGISFRQESDPLANTYKGSYAKAWCEEFYSAHFSETEKSYIIPTYKDDPAFAIRAGFAQGDRGPMVNFDPESKALDGDHLFLLSAEEGSNPDYGLGEEESRVAGLFGTAQSYWLRSPHDKSFANDVGMVFYNGWLMDFIQNSDNVFMTGPTCMRPALNLDLSLANLQSVGEGKWRLGDSYSGETYVTPPTPKENIMPNVMLSLGIVSFALILGGLIVAPIILVRHHKRKAKKKNL